MKIKKRELIMYVLDTIILVMILASTNNILVLTFALIAAILIIVNIVRKYFVKRDRILISPDSEKDIEEDKKEDKE